MYPRARCTKQINIGLLVELTTAGTSVGQTPQDVPLVKERHHHLPRQEEFGSAGIVAGSLGGHVRHHLYECNVMVLVAPAQIAVPLMNPA